MTATTETPAAPARGIAAEDRVPIGQKVGFAMGINMEIIASNLTFGVLWLPVFNIGLGINPVLLSGILIVMRVWDAFADPMMGNITDNARTRWGRRRPFIFAGALATALVYPLFWHIPGDWSETGRIVALTGIGLLFFTCYTLWSMPYFGLQLELTPSYDERTRMAAWNSAFAKLGYLGMGWVFAFVLLAGMLATGDPQPLEGRSEFVRSVLESVQPLFAWLASPVEGETTVIVGMRAVGWFLAIGIFIFGASPALFVRERYYQAEARRQPKTPFLQSLRETSHCKPLWQLIGMTFFLLVGSASIGGLGQYVNFYYVCGGDLAQGAIIAGWKSTVVIATGFVSIPVLTWLSERYDKRAIVLAMLTFTIVGHSLNYVLMTPQYPYLQIVSGVVEAVAISAIWMFMPAMKADVADWDESQTSRRREGSLNSFYSWFVKAALVMSLGLGGVALELSGFDAKLAVQDDAAVIRMFHIYLWLPVVFWVVAVVFAWFYPLGRARAAEVRALLEQRRGKV